MGPHPAFEPVAAVPVPEGPPEKGIDVPFEAPE